MHCISADGERRLQLRAVAGHAAADSAHACATAACIRVQAYLFAPAGNASSGMRSMASSSIAEASELKAPPITAQGRD